jgi:signal transduction histidine kinase
LVELRPSTLVEYGLAEALRKLTEDWQTNNHIPVNLAVYLGGSHIPVGVQEVIFRVAQEGLTNIAKHAKATAVDMSLVEGQSQIMFSLTDDGIGFKSENARNNARFGLISMQERTRAIGGSLAIESDTQKGTTIRLKLPLFVAEVAK